MYLFLFLGNSKPGFICHLSGWAESGSGMSQKIYNATCLC